MEKDRIISFITSYQSFDDFPEVIEWINKTEENKEEYIRYKNLWAIMQKNYDMPEEKIKEALFRIRKKQIQKMKPSIFWSLMKYAALVAIVLMCGYLFGTLDVNRGITMNEIFVPNGNRSSIVLPDGSKVWINNGTKLIYPGKFIGKNRNVELEGEGFFDVAHDKAHPFVVKIGQNRIKVLGTKFALVAYPNDKLIKAELISGQIQFDVKEINQTDKFHSYLMEPSQSLSYNKSSGELIQSRIADSFYNYWINGVYEFNDETFEELAKKIERIYNVKVIFKDEILKKCFFRGTLSVNDNVYTLMEVFAKASGKPFNYSHEGNEIYIEKK